MTITVDNASSNDTVIGYLKRHLRSNVLNGLYIHMRCATHIMNLVVGDGLKINDNAITRVRDAIRYVFFYYFLILCIIRLLKICYFSQSFFYEMQLDMCGLLLQGLSSLINVLKKRGLNVPRVCALMSRLVGTPHI